MEVIEQITYLLFLKRLDENHTREEKRANLLGQPLQNAVFPDGLDPQGRPYSDLRWSKFKDFSQSEMFTAFSQSVFPFLRNELPKQVVDVIDSINMDGKDTKGDLYEYMLSKLASAGTNGQFRTTGMQ